MAETSPSSPPVDTFDEDIPVVESFDAMELDNNLLRGIYSYGWEKPSPIQQRAVVPFTKGGDIIAQAQSGTGKTGAFTVGLLQRMDFSKVDKCQALVLSPTRELAAQNELVISAIGEYLGQNICHLFVGGTRVTDDLRRLQSGVLVAVGTPGRVFDVIKRGALRTDSLKILVLDEADEMLSQGFSEQIYEIFRFLPQSVQVALFSATMPDDVLELATKFMRNPTRILVKKEQVTLEGIKQFYVAVEDQHKLETLVDLYETVSIAQSVIFCNTRRRVEWLAEEMNKKGHTVSSLHSELKKEDREKIMQQFRSGQSRVLITTDLLSRGIDVHHVSIVVNFDLPAQKESYLHRIGRSGRYGRKGVAINFVTEKDLPVMHELESFYHTQIEELPMDFAKYLQ